MSGHDRKADERMVDVMLVGGPADFPESGRRMRIEAARAQQKIKIEHLGGYQHFEPSDTSDTSGTSTGREPRVFRWTGSTKIAE
ncbi:DUF5988 family protein [Streptomyces albus]|uniref:Uncharacterized protein n=1 Tax=Streptomyces albus TaxID=1888 RepID=A0A6C1BZ62_9ACTN|nr:MULTISPECIES: DUF5988 family protein [Streptomyces]KPC65873.1 hypothetical protein ADL27_60560 [Streptomyces sp. NRRL F-6602]EPD96826.1 hypothetical protein HMPREF1486_00436 [Streptomyces sp. HPH0547]QID34937.1 hypothetical protein G3260_000819 [Streptomyces albus]TGG76219.1 hypothetical protein D8771_29845 [Streptomyces albus]UVN58259.1 DUF5988 family protein [Streptomyces albus]